MKPRVHVITLAVEDLERSLSFYRSLGLKSEGVVATEFRGDEEMAAGAIAIFELEGLFLCVFPRGELAKDAKTPWRHRVRACSASDTQLRAGTKSTP